MKGNALKSMLAAFLLVPVAYAAGPVNELDSELTPLGLLHPSSTVVETMFADLDAMSDDVHAEGRLVLQGWYDQNEDFRQTFRADVVVVVPSKLPGFDTLANAMAADVRLRMSHHGVAYAECLLAVEPVLARSHVRFAVDLVAIWDDVKPNRGVCDINLVDPGLQVGVPTLADGVYIQTFVGGKPHEAFEFLEGYCE